MLAPFHDFASKVPAALQTELTTIKPEIISGKISRHQEPGVSTGASLRLSARCTGRGELAGRAGPGPAR